MNLPITIVFLQSTYTGVYSKLGPLVVSIAQRALPGIVSEKKQKMQMSC